MTEHRWSGWPGATCLDCHVEDPREHCIGTCSAQPSDADEFPNVYKCPVHGEEIRRVLVECPNSLDTQVERLGRELSAKDTEIHAMENALADLKRERDEFFEMVRNGQASVERADEVRASISELRERLNEAARLIRAGEWHAEHFRQKWMGATRHVFQARKQTQWLEERLREAQITIRTLRAEKQALEADLKVSGAMCKCGGKCLSHLKPGEWYAGDPPCEVGSGAMTAGPVRLLTEPSPIKTAPSAPGTDQKAAFLRPEVEIFARAMELRLRAKDDERCGNSWQNGADVRELLDYLQKKVNALSYALAVSGMDGRTLEQIGTDVLARAADVGNLALIVADWFGATGNIEHLEAQVTDAIPPR